METHCIGTPTGSCCARRNSSHATSHEEIGAFRLMQNVVFMGKASAAAATYSFICMPALVSSFDCRRGVSCAAAEPPAAGRFFSRYAAKATWSFVRHRISVKHAGLTALGSWIQMTARHCLTGTAEHCRNWAHRPYPIISVKRILLHQEEKGETEKKMKMYKQKDTWREQVKAIRCLA